MEAIRLLLALAVLSASLRSGRGLEEGLSSMEVLAEEANGYPEKLIDWMSCFFFGYANEPLVGSFTFHDIFTQQEIEDQSPPEEHPLGVLIRSLLHAVQRPGRSPSFLFQPQRFGRDARGSSTSSNRVNPRAWDSMAPQFLSMATPQRFGKKK